MHLYCEKAIDGKKLVLKRSVLYLGNDTQWLDLRLRPWTALRRGGGEHSKISAKRARMLSQRSERLGMEPLQSAVS